MVEDKEETVRLIGVNTPESVDPRTTVECFGHEASNKMKELIKDKSIYLVKDASQQERDKYGRLLGYVFLEDGTFINEKMIADGYAFEYTYNIPYKYQKDFKSLENIARAGETGLWNKSVCNYNENPKKVSSKKRRIK
jgi:micrococcal nuclease